jgi:nucleotide-binding universal stress UspA family protein
MKTARFNRILLATDGSRQADAAVDVAIGFAKASAASVDVVHVWNLAVHHRHGGWDAETRSEAESLITETVSRLRSAGVRAAGQLMQADPAHIASAIAEAARQSRADLVVAGSRALSDWQSMIKHSVSHQLLRTLDCPILIVHAKADSSSGGSRRILAAIAGGDDVRPAMRAAIAAASEWGSEVLVVHVAQTFVGAQGFAYIEPGDEIHATLENATSLLKEAGITCEAIVARADAVTDVVARLAAEWRADLIVIGSSRMGDLGSMIFGSVPHGLLRATDRPLLVAERISR